MAVKIGMRRRESIENPVLGLEVDVWHQIVGLASARSRVSQMTAVHP